VRDPRWAMSIPPALIGLLPTPGGAMLSAPIVEESSKKLNVSPEQKTFVNYWFRHLWEYFWPLYPGLIVASAILKVPIPNMIRLQYPMTLGAIFCGILFGILNIEKSMNEKKEKSKFFPEFLHFNINIWPIWFILIGLMVIKIPIVFILSSIVIILLIIVKLERKQIWMVFKKSASLKIIVLLFAVMIFKHIVMDSSLVQAIPAMLASSRISSLIPLSIIPFIFGLLTGVNQAYVGVTFPLLLPIFGGVNINLKLAMFAYNSGLFGVLLSPAHLCLLLTKEYFAANWRKIYRKLIPSVLIVFIISVILLFI
jgi:integral membrane protein (TIGR00529 family)